MNAFEVNFDGLVGPTHNYSGLSCGNVASMREAHAPSNPRLAARQGLAKMKALYDLGFKQGVLAPQMRPDIASLRALGFSGADAELVQQVARQAPTLLAAVSSASSMWSANAATVSPSADCADGRVHFTVANLNNTFHRSIEAPQTRRTLDAVFADAEHFVVHPALPSQMHFGDEGAANHTCFNRLAGAAGVEFFVYGASAFDRSLAVPHRFPARQTREASESVARLHGLDPERVVFAQQHPETIDQGVFHNDVIAVGHRQLLFCHQKAFVDQPRVIDKLRAKLEGCGAGLQLVEVSDEQVTVAEAVETYLFNSQLLSRPDGSMLLVVPEESLEHPRVCDYLTQLTQSGSPIAEVRAFDLRQSMHNGGGPACLRLRVELTEAELARVNPGVLMSDRLYRQLDDWIERHYRDRLTAADLADPALLQETQTALDELSNLLQLGSIYPFQ